MMEQSQIVDIAGKELRLTNLSKVIWPESRLTKADLLDYHYKVAEYSLRHWRDRPMTLTRYPNGIDAEFFYQKNKPDYTPPWIDSVTVAAEEKQIDYVLVNDLPTLVYLVNQAAIEFHPATSRFDDLEHPDHVIVDLDPTAPAGFSEAAEIAHYVRPALNELGLRGYLKTSGASGIHILIPIERRYSYRQTSSLAKLIGQVLWDFYPNKVTLERLIKKRRGVYVDYLQNASSKTIVGVYSPRPLPGAPVSTPLLWDELAAAEPRQFTIKTVPERLREVGDLFGNIAENAQNIDHLLKFLDG